MRFRIGMMTGFAAGYYLGARAGRERYEQMNEWLAKVRRTRPVDTAIGEAERIVDQGVERAVETIQRSSDGNGHAGHGQGQPDTRAPVGSSAPAGAAPSGPVAHGMPGTPGDGATGPAPGYGDAEAVVGGMTPRPSNIGP